MPKEYIITEHDERKANEQGGQVLAIRVGWDKGVLPQLATVLKGAVEGSPDKTLVEVDQGWFIDLDRDTIQALIKSLRKARRVAFGADK